MKRADLIRHLESHGCLFVREGSNHTVYRVASIKIGATAKPKAFSKGCGRAAGNFGFRISELREKAVLQILLQIRNPQFEIPNPQSEIRNSKPAIRNSQDAAPGEVAGVADGEGSGVGFSIAFTSFRSRSVTMPRPRYQIPSPVSHTSSASTLVPLVSRIVTGPRLAFPSPPVDTGLELSAAREDCV